MNEDHPRGITVSSRETIARESAAATVRLAELTKAYNDAPENVIARAEQELARLQSDEHFQNRKLTSAAVRDQENMLRAKISDARAKLDSNRLDTDPVGAIMKGIVPPEEPDTSNGSRARAVDQVEAVKDFRSQGIPEKMIHELLSGKKPTPEMYQRGKELQARRMADPDWLKRLTAGDRATVIEFLDMSWCVGCFEPPA